MNEYINKKDDWDSFVNKWNTEHEEEMIVADKADESIGPRLAIKLDDYKFLRDTINANSNAFSSDILKEVKEIDKRIEMIY